MLISTLSRTPVRNDPAGSGEFLAARQERAHYGVDYYAWPEAPVHAHTDLEFIKTGIAYSQTQEFKYIELLDGALHLRYFYVQPDQHFLAGQIIQTGDRLGKAQDIAAFYPNSSMQNHVHFEVYYVGKVETGGLQSAYHATKNRTYIDPIAYLDRELR